MNPVFIVALGVGIAATIYDHCSSETREAERQYEEYKTVYINTSNKLENDIEEKKRKINEEKKKYAKRARREVEKAANREVDTFPYFHERYIECIKTANIAYNAKKRCESIIKVKKKYIRQTLTEMNRMYEQTKTNISRQEKEKIHSELAYLKKLKETLYEELNLQINERQNFLDKVRKFNNATHDLKLYIRDNCPGGIEWFYYREERKATEELLKELEQTSSRMSGLQLLEKGKTFVRQKILPAITGKGSAVLQFFRRVQGKG